MKLVVSALRVLMAAGLHLSTVRTATLDRGMEKSRNEVPIMEVIQRSTCQPREVLLNVQREFPADIVHKYVPPCVVLRRCMGCCNDEAMECVPTKTDNLTLEVIRWRPKVSQHAVHLNFTEHVNCVCRLKSDVKGNTE